MLPVTVPPATRLVSPLPRRAPAWPPNADFAPREATVGRHQPPSLGRVLSPSFSFLLPPSCLASTPTTATATATATATTAAATATATAAMNLPPVFPVVAAASHSWRLPPQPSRCQDHFYPDSLEIRAWNLSFLIPADNNNNNNDNNGGGGLVLATALRHPTGRGLYLHEICWPVCKAYYRGLIDERSQISSPRPPIHRTAPVPAKGCLKRPPPRSRARKAQPDTPCQPKRVTFSDQALSSCIMTHQPYTPSIGHSSVWRAEWTLECRVRNMLCTRAEFDRNFMAQAVRGMSTPPTADHHDARAPMPFRGSSKRDDRLYAQEIPGMYQVRDTLCDLLDHALGLPLHATAPRHMVPRPTSIPNIGAPPPDVLNIPASVRHRLPPINSQVAAQIITPRNHYQEVVLHRAHLLRRKIRHPPRVCGHDHSGGNNDAVTPPPVIGQPGDLVGAWARFNHRRERRAHERRAIDISRGERGRTWDDMFDSDMSDDTDDEYDGKEKQEELLNQRLAVAIYLRFYQQNLAEERARWELSWDHEAFVVRFWRKCPNRDWKGRACPGVHADRDHDDAVLADSESTDELATAEDEGKADGSGVRDEGIVV